MLDSQIPSTYLLTLSITNLINHTRMVNIISCTTLLHLYNSRMLPFISFLPYISLSQVITLFPQNIVQNTHIVNII